MRCVSSQVSWTALPIPRPNGWPPHCATWRARNSISECADSGHMSADPIALFEETVQRFHAEDWDGVAELCDDASLSEFRRNFLQRFKPDRYTPLTAEFYLSHSPDMPREVAEYQAEQHRKYSDPQYQLRQEMPQIGSFEELRALSARELYVAWLRRQSLRGEVEKQLAAGELSPEIVEHALATLAGQLSYRPLGA